MKYDFETAPVRKDLGALKWDLMYKDAPAEPESIIPFSVADMEFKNPPQFLEGMSEYAKAPIYGYTWETENYYDSVIGFMKKRHDWEIEKDWIVLSSGVVPALYHLSNAFSAPGEGIIIMRPVYYPFSSAIEGTGRRLENVPLIEKDGIYSMDYEALEKAAAKPDVKMMIFCSPHNPVGRVWNKDELMKVARICIDNDVLIVSDEIHFDFVMKGYEHTVMAKLSEEVAQKIIVCTAPSKSFNLGGVQVSNIIIPNDDIREKYKKSLSASGFLTLNTFAFKACELVYSSCQDWLDELVEVLEDNKKFVEDYIAKNIPQISVIPLEGTYLMWLDCRKLGLNPDELKQFMQKKAHLHFDEGALFGPEGEGFERWNIACPKKKIQEGLERLHKAVSEINK